MTYDLGEFVVDLAFLEEPAELSVRFPAVRPQALLLTFLNEFVGAHDRAVASSTCLAMFDSLGISHHAARSTLTRAVNRGLLARHRRGKHLYLGVTERAAEILTDVKKRVGQDGPVVRDWDGTWTVLTFSLPQESRTERHDLRCRLRWASFFLLQSGVWVAPRRADVRPIVDDLSSSASLQVFYGQPANPIDLDQLIGRAYDVRALAAGFERFVDRWGQGDPLPEASDDLARLLLLSTEWQVLLGDCPRVPSEHLPVEWLVLAAEHAYWQRRDELSPGARAVVSEIMDTIGASPVAGPAGGHEDRIGHGHPRTSWG